MHILPERFVKDPDDSLDYRWDFTAWLDGDTITDKQIIIDDDSPAPVTASGLAGTDTTVTVTLAAGTLGTSVPVTCRITTAQGRIKDATPIFDIRVR
jgi:hypothetical protein